MSRPELKVLEQHVEQLRNLSHDTDTSKRGQKVARTAARKVMAWLPQLAAGDHGPEDVTLLLMKQYWQKRHIIGKQMLGEVMANAGFKFAEAVKLTPEETDEQWSRAQEAARKTSAKNQLTK